MLRTPARFRLQRARTQRGGSDHAILEVIEVLGVVYDLYGIDEIIRETATDIVDRLNQHSDNAMESLKRVAERASPLSDTNSEPSALEQWSNRHGILPRETPDGLRFEFDRPVSRWELQKIIRAGLDAVERSSMMTKRFEDAMIGSTAMARLVIITGSGISTCPGAVDSNRHYRNVALTRGITAVRPDLFIKKPRAIPLLHLHLMCSPIPIALPIGPLIQILSLIGNRGLRLRT